VWLRLRALPRSLGPRRSTPTRGWRSPTCGT
jgi:hypothetical protein